MRSARGLVTACSRLCAGALPSRSWTAVAGLQTTERQFVSSARAVADLLQCEHLNTRLWTGGFSTLPRGDGSELGGTGTAREEEAGSTDEDAREQPAKKSLRHRGGSAPGPRDANGLSILDARTLDFLVEKGVKGGDRAQLERWLRSTALHDGSTWPFETVFAMWAWLEEVSQGAGWPETRKRGGESVSIVRYMVELYPNLLCQDATTLQRKWELLQAPESEGGLGLTQAGELVSSFPPVLGLDIKSVREKMAFLRAQGVADVAACVRRFPSILGNSEETILGRMERLRDHGLDPVDMLQCFPPTFGLSDVDLEAKLRFLLGALRFSPSTLQSNPSLLGRSLDGNMHIRVALLRELGELPPPPLGDGKKVKGRSLRTFLMMPSTLFVEHLVEHGHPTIRTLADLEKTATPKRLAAAKEWEKERIAEAERMGLIPPPLTPFKA